MERASPPLFSWLHISDIHFGHGKSTEREHRKLVLDTFLTHLRSLQERFDVPQPDAVFVTGDIGFSGDVLGRAEYEQAAAWLHQLRQALGLKAEHVYLVPGNHDVARVDEKNEGPAFHLVQELRARKPRRIDDIFDDEDAHRLLAGRMRNYSAFATRFGPPDTDGGSRQRPAWVHRPQTRGNLPLRIVGLNTALLANDDKDYKQLDLGFRQLNIAFDQREENEVIVALSHHPPEWLARGKEVEGWLESRADILLSGHVHQQESLMRQRGGGRRFVHVAAGALHEVAHEPGAPTSFSFNFGALREGDDGHLQLQVWPFVWGRNHRFQPDLSYLHNAGQYFNSHPLECLAPSRAQASVTPRSRHERPPEQPAARAPDVGLTEAMASYKSDRAKDSRIRRLDLSRLVGITKGPVQNELDLLDFVVAPSLQEGNPEHGEHAAKLRRQLRAPGLEPSERKTITEQLKRLEQLEWAHPDHLPGQTSEPISLAEALHRHRQLTVIGEPGAGKSILTRLSLLACTEGEAGTRARERLRADDVFNPHADGTLQSLRSLMPVRIILGDFGRERTGGREASLMGFIQQQLDTQKASPLLKLHLEALLHDGAVFLLCDGFDEVPEAQRERVGHELTTFAEQFPKARILVTSRPHGYTPRIGGFKHTRLAPLHNRQQRLLVSQLHRLVEVLRSDDAQGIARARHRTEALLQTIQSRREWHDLSSNPLLLTLSALTNTDEGDIPKHRIFVFENFVRTILGKWRATLKELDAQIDPLLDVWSSVASDWVRSERRHGVERGRLLRTLATALAAARIPSSIDAERALHLALESGLVREDDGTIAFWHSTFAEFLTARALTSPERRAARCILEMPRLSPLVLQLAAARLCHVLDDEEETTTLARGLLARDSTGSGRLFRPGLRAVSACMADGVSFHESITEGVWEAWVEVLERTPPSPLWTDFCLLTRRITRVRLPASFVTRLSRVDDHDMYEIREGVARLVAPFADKDDSARAACERWLSEDSFTQIPFHGALGLAQAGVWTEPVLTGLGRLNPDERFEAASVRALLRKGGASVLTLLRTLVQAPALAEAASSGSTPQLGDPRISAACLLAISGHWNDDVTAVMKQMLSHNNHFNRQHKMKAVIRNCADQSQVRQALFQWFLDEPTLRTNAVDIIRDIAPCIEHMPEEVMELTARAEGDLLTQLESLLVSIGEERRTLIDLLRHRLGDGSQERKRSAARILLRLIPGDPLLQEALRQGMNSRADENRVFWARHALFLGEPLAETARDTMLDCALSPEPAPRKQAHDWMYQWVMRSKQTPPAAWMARASAPDTSEAARLDAAQFILWTNDTAVAVSLLKNLLDTAKDEQIRRTAAHELLELNEVDSRVATLALKEAIHSRNALLRHRMEWLKPHAKVLVPVLLQELSNYVPPQDQHGWGMGPAHVWSSLLGELVTEEPSCVLELMQALESPGLANRCAEITLDQLKERPPVRKAILRQLQDPGLRMNPGKMSTVLWLGIAHEETKPTALQVLQTLAPQSLDQLDLAWIARRLRDEKEAARLWQLTLDGEDLHLSLSAAMALAIHFPDEALASIPPTLTRLLRSPDVFQRIDAARLALRCGCLEQEALEVLFECLTLRTGRPQQQDTDWGHHALREAIVHGPAVRDRALRGLIDFNPRVDMEAVHALCVYRPNLGLSRLAEWLETEEEAQLTSAVRVLCTRDGYREQVRGALEKHIASVPFELIDSLTDLVERYDLHSARMTEQCLGRLTPDLNEFDRLPRCLAAWLKRFPDNWTLLLKQEPSRRAELAMLLQYDIPCNAEAIAFALDTILSHPYGRFVEVAISAVEHWTSPGPPDKPPSESTDTLPPSLSPEEARARIRELLLAQNAPRELFALHHFDRLAQLAQLSTHHRVENLLHALDIDLAVLEDGPFSPTDLIRLKTTAGMLLHELGCRDERIQPLLESALLVSARVSMGWMFDCASALDDSRLARPETRRLLIQSAVAPVGYFSARPKTLVALLTRAGMSSDDILDVQLTSIGLDVREEWTLLRQSGDRALWNERFFVEETLDNLSCPAERRALILREFVFKYAARFSEEMKLSLAARSDLPDALAAKLLLHLFTRPGRDRSEALEKWRARFKLEAQDESDDMWPYSQYTSLSMQFDMLEKLSHTEHPAILREVLFECAAVPAEELRPLYEEARSVRVLSDAQWSELSRGFSVNPDDEKTVRLSKQWLTASLWWATRAREAEAA